MTTVKFIQDFDFVPHALPNICIAYKKGMTETVTRECAEKAIELGKATETSKPKRKGKVDGPKA